MMKTIAVVGAGPGLGLSVAKTFGKHGFRVALVARREESLGQLTDVLRALQIEARGFVADVTDERQIVSAFSDIKAAFGAVDVVEYSPLRMEFIPSSQLTAAVARKAFELYVLGAIASVQQVLPEMIKNQNGAFLFTVGRSALMPMSRIASLSTATAALRNYAYTLNEELTPKGIYAGIIVVCRGIKPEDAESIAALHYDMCLKRDRVEEVYGENIRIRDGFPVRV